MRYSYLTGCQWRCLPAYFPAWSVVYCYLAQWRDNGLLERLYQAERLA